MRPEASRVSSPNPTANLVGSRKAGPGNAAKQFAAFLIWCFFDGSPSVHLSVTFGVSYAPPRASGFNEQSFRERLLEFRTAAVMSQFGVNFRTQKPLHDQLAFGG